MRRPRIAHVHFRTRHNVGDQAVVTGIRRLLRDRLGRIRWSTVPLKALQTPADPSVVEFLNRHDLVVFGGGGLYSRWGLPVDPRVIDGIRVPYVIFGAGFNRNTGELPPDDELREGIRHLQARAALIGVRDRATVALAAQCGGAADYIGDPALALSPQRPWWYSEGAWPRIAVNMAAHDWAAQQEFLPRALHACAKAVGALAREHGGGRLLYLVHSDAERRERHAIRRLFPEIRIRRYPAHQLAWVYGRLDLVVSMMLHSSILAFSAGTPFVNIAYDDKNRAFMDDIGHAERCLPVDRLEPAALYRAARDALAGGRDDPEDRKRLQAMRNQLAAFADRTAGLIAA